MTVPAMKVYCRPKSARASTEHEALDGAESEEMPERFLAISLIAVEAYSYGELLKN